MNVVSRALVSALALVCALALGACNTIEGIGKDIKSGGKAIEKTAEDAKS